MNIIDWIIVAILGISTLIGFYRGFISSVASMGGSLVSLGLSYWLSPKLVEWVQQNTTIGSTIGSYADAAIRAGDMGSAQVSAVAQNQGMLDSVLKEVQLPAPLDSLLRTNIQNQAFAGDRIYEVKDYVVSTVESAVLNIICFIICFIVLMILFHIIINLLNHIFKFPVLKQLNSVAGGAFGLLRGVLLCFVAFALLPLIQTIIPIKGADDLIQGSILAPVFNSTNLILSIMKGHL